MTDQSLRSRFAGIVGPGLVDRVVDLLEEAAATRCADSDCVRRRRHSLLDWHQWTHEAGAPRTRGLLGWRCFNCGQYVWRRIHKPTTARQDGARS